MKKFALTLALIAMSVCAAYAQKYQPRDTWPYIYEDFMDGVVRTRSGSLVTEAKLNICISDGSLHFIKEDKIMKIDMSTIYTALVGKDLYVNMGSKMYRVLVEKERGYVLQLTTIDIDKMNKVEIGYGISSSSASAMNVNSLTESSSDMVNMRFDNAKLQKDNGNYIDVAETRYIFAAGRLIEASKANVREFPGVDKAAADAFIKANKIKWNKTESLELLIDFVADQFDK